MYYEWERYLVKPECQLRKWNLPVLDHYTSMPRLCQRGHTWCGRLACSSERWVSPLRVRACHWLIQVPLAHGLPLDSCFPLTSAEANRENNHFLTFILCQWTHLDDRNPHIRKCVWSMWDIFVALEETTGVIYVNVSYTLFWFSLCSFMSLDLGKNYNCRFPRSLVEEVPRAVWAIFIWR